MLVKKFEERREESSNGNRYREIEIDEQINKWLSDNFVEIIDIKYSSSISCAANEMGSVMQSIFSALVMYEEL